MSLLLAVHIVAGTAALSSMAIPLVTRKGSRAHRRAGWVFAAGMGVVSITALLLAGDRFLHDATPQGRMFGLFLLYIAVLTGSAVRAGIRVLRHKRQQAARACRCDVAIAVLLIAVAAAALAYGIASGRVLFIAFSLVGLLNGIGQLRYWLGGWKTPMAWWFAHMGNMLASCIAALTAFAVINAGNLGLPATSPIVWLAPSAIGVPVTILWTRYYKARFRTGGSQIPNTSASHARPSSPGGPM